MLGDTNDDEPVSAQPATPAPSHKRDPAAGKPPVGVWTWIGRIGAALGLLGAAVGGVGGFIVALVTQAAVKEKLSSIEATTSKIWEAQVITGAYFQSHSHKRSGDLHIDKDAAERIKDMTPHPGAGNLPQPSASAFAPEAPEDDAPTTPPIPSGAVSPRTGPNAPAPRGPKREMRPPPVCIDSKSGRRMPCEATDDCYPPGYFHPKHELELRAKAGDPAGQVSICEPRR